MKAAHIFWKHPEFIKNSWEKRSKIQNISKRINIGQEKNTHTHNIDFLVWLIALSGRVLLTLLKTQVAGGKGRNKFSGVIVVGEIHQSCSWLDFYQRDFPQLYYFLSARYALVGYALGLLQHT